jgi:biofilm PGA synthesis N-glycosyltransferase PgaC
MSLAAVALTLSAGVITFILGVYPLLTAMGRRRKATAVRKDFAYRPTVSVILAVHNGGGFLRAKLESVLALDYPRELREVLVVSDGSTDDTESIAQEFASDGVRLIQQAWRGKAAALNHAMSLAKGEVFFFTDVRQRLAPRSLIHLVANLADPSVGAVSGALVIVDQRPGEQSDLGLYWRYETWMRKRHSEIYSVFNATGCIYVQRRALAAALPEDTLADDAALPLQALLGGFRVVLEKDAVAYDLPIVAGGEFRRRLRTLAGLWQVCARSPRLFTTANRMRFDFLAHKFSRLVLPWAILTGAFATLALPDSNLRELLLAGGAALLLLAAADFLIPAGFPLKRFTSIPRTFLSMNVAALLAVTVFLVDPRRFWGRTRVDGGK